MSIRCEKCGCELTIEQVDFIGNVKNGPDGKMHTDRKCIEHLRTQLDELEAARKAAMAGPSTSQAWGEFWPLLANRAEELIAAARRVDALAVERDAAIARAEKAEASLLDANEWISVYKEWADVAARTLAKFEGTSRRGAHG